MRLQFSMCKRIVVKLVAESSSLFNRESLVEVSFYFYEQPCPCASIVTHYVGIGQECIKGIVNYRDRGQAYSFVSDLAVVGIEAAAPPRPAAGSGAWGARDYRPSLQESPPSYPATPAVARPRLVTKHANSPRPPKATIRITVGENASETYIFPPSQTRSKGEGSLSFF